MEACTDEEGPLVGVLGERGQALAGVRRVYEE